jgi:aminocarboxymuconate-semialdehyde decarboxylase
MKLDIFNHIFPAAYYKRMLEIAPRGKDMHKRVREIPCIVDLDERFRIMDQFGADYAQVICLPSPPIEDFGRPKITNELARLANDGMAELVRRFPERFPAFIASLPMNDPKGLLREAKRAIRDLGAVGVQVFTNVLGVPLTARATMPLFELMAELDRPIWLHPPSPLSAR